jgi:hypothetical protein
VALNIDDHPAQRPLETVFHTIDYCWMRRQRARFHLSSWLWLLSSNLQRPPGAPEGVGAVLLADSRLEFVERQQRRRKLLVKLGCRADPVVLGQLAEPGALL